MQMYGTHLVLVLVEAKVLVLGAKPGIILTIITLRNSAPNIALKSVNLCCVRDLGASDRCNLPGRNWYCFCTDFAFG